MQTVLCFAPADHKVSYDKTNLDTFGWAPYGFIIVFAFLIVLTVDEIFILLILCSLLAIHALPDHEPTACDQLCLSICVSLKPTGFSLSLIVIY